MRAMGFLWLWAQFLKYTWERTPGLLSNNDSTCKVQITFQDSLSKILLNK